MTPRWRCGCWSVAAASWPGPHRADQPPARPVAGAGARWRQKGFLSAPQARALLSTVRPRDIVGRTRRQLASELITELAVVDKKIKNADLTLTELVKTTGSSLLQLNGIGPSGATRLLGDIADISGSPVRATLRPGTAPHRRMPPPATSNAIGSPAPATGASTGSCTFMAVVQLSHDTQGRAYFRGKLAAGKAAMEAMRCLKRRLSNVVY